MSLTRWVTETTHKTANGLDEVIKRGDDIVAWAFSPEDARRIVACVNACEGVGTKLLEDFPQGMNGMSKVIIAKQRDEIKAQRDEILFALEQLFSLHEPEGRFQPSHFKPILKIAKDAIEKAKAGAS